MLRQGVAAYDGSADLHHALGLSLVRRKRLPEALSELQRAARLNPENTRYVYVYAVALNSSGKAREALTVLQDAHNANPNDTDILSALVAFHRDAGNNAQSAGYARKLEALAP